VGQIKFTSMSWCSGPHPRHHAAAGVPPSSGDVRVPSPASVSRGTAPSFGAHCSSKLPLGMRPARVEHRRAPWPGPCCATCWPVSCAGSARVGRPFLPYFPFKAKPPALPYTLTAYKRHDYSLHVCETRRRTPWLSSPSNSPFCSLL
jgi:hypothetical protein